jgi:hypothetical protein
MKDMCIGDLPVFTKDSLKQVTMLEVVDTSACVPIRRSMCSKIKLSHLLNH